MDKIREWCLNKLKLFTGQISILTVWHQQRWKNFQARAWRRNGSVWSIFFWWRSHSIWHCWYQWRWWNWYWWVEKLSFGMMMGLMIWWFSGEFVQLMFPNAAEIVSQLKRNFQSVDDVERIFKTWDLNGDNAISFTELQVNIHQSVHLYKTEQLTSS